jgi:uncharacterized OsmC-like protein
MNKKQTCCACQAQARPVLSAKYERHVHTVAAHATLKKKIVLEGCCGGQGAELNPLDLVALGLASCLLIMMGKLAQARKLNIFGATASVSYVMANYRLKAFKVDVGMPKKLGAKTQAVLEAESKKCPVFLALAPKVNVAVNFNWPK